jgi:hypothetical protein
MSGHRALIIAVAALICLVLLGGAVLAGPLPASGGGYRLTPSPWQVQGTAGGPGYLLQGQSYLLQAGPCCCAYLPCTMRSAP